MRIARREFVRGVAASALLAPFVGMMQSDRGRAQDANVAKRLVVFFTPNGTVHRHWRPTGDGASFAFPAGSILEPLAPHQPDLVVLDGIDFYGTSNHEAGMAAMLTGNGTDAHESRGLSVDQFVADAVGATSRFPSLELGVQTSAWGGNVQTRMSYRGPGQFVPPDDDPVGVHRRLFGGLSPMPDGGMASSDPRVLRRRSVLDVIRGDLADLTRRAPAAERAKLEAHADALRRSELGLAGAMAGMAACDAGAAPEPGAPLDNDRFPFVGRAQMDLLVTALSCGMTRVASIQWAHTVAPQVFTWLGVSEGHHALSHMDDSNEAGVADFVKAERWFAEQLAYLLDRLAELPEPEGEGRMLDHTLVVWAKELGDGRLHDCSSVPFVLAGANRVWTTGRHLQLGGVPHQKLLVSICQAMGLTNRTFGDPSHGTGPIDELMT